ncbi:MAG: hypothetical protein IKV60_00225 [Rikenellaceae bacterium]|nr:hypothetical protein [Rikenellaceae bacterium]
MKRIINIAVLYFCAVLLSGCNLFSPENFSTMFTYAQSVTLLIENGSQFDSLNVLIERQNTRIDQYNIKQTDTAKYELCYCKISNRWYLNELNKAEELRADLLGNYYNYSEWGLNFIAQMQIQGSWINKMRVYDNKKEFLLDNQLLKVWDWQDKENEHSPLVLYPYEISKNWRCVIADENMDNPYVGLWTHIECTFTITDDDLIPEESAEE